MLGTAGIGHHLLRLHDPGRVPPVLLAAGSRTGRRTNTLRAGSEVKMI